MNIKLIKFKISMKRKISSFLQITLKPLVILADHVNHRKYEKIKLKCKTISDEELMARFAKHLIKSMIKANNSWNKEKHFMLFNKGAFRYDTHEDFEERILYQLKNIPYSCKDKILQSWHLHTDKRALISPFNDENQLAMVEYERKLHKLLKAELEKLNINIEYIDIRKEHGNVMLSFYKRWLDRIGYEKTLVVKV